MKKGRQVKIYLPAELIKQATKAAFSENESFSGFVRKLLTSALKKAA